MLSRLSMATTTFESQRKQWKKEGADMLKGFCPMTLHLKAGNVVLVSTYFLPGEGLLGANQERVRALSRFLLTLRDPWIVAADFNMEPTELLKSGWPAAIGGCIICPEGLEATCDQGQCRMLDYVVVAPGRLPQATV